MTIKTVHTSDIPDYIKKYKSFELIWNENKTELLAFFAPLWQFLFLLQFLSQKQIHEVIIIYIL